MHKLENNRRAVIGSTATIANSKVNSTSFANNRVRVSNKLCSSSSLISLNSSSVTHLLNANKKSSNLSISTNNSKKYNNSNTPVKQTRGSNRKLNIYVGADEHEDISYTEPCSKKSDPSSTLLLKNNQSNSSLFSR